jgi:hypothetical protein
VRVVFDDFPPEVDLLQRRMSFWLRKSGDLVIERRIKNSCNSWLRRIWFLSFTLRFFVF